MSVHYKFKSALEYDTVTFDGLHISVRDLKKSILHQKRIGKNTDFDLQVTNAQTKEVYTDDNALIAKNTSLIIARIPLTAQQKKAWDRSEANQQREGGRQEGIDAGMHRMIKTVDLSSLDASEEDKILAMMSQSTQEYSPSNYMKIRGANQTGVVPPNYRCFKCHNSGHWIKDCPLGSTQEPMEIKKSTGIPKSFMVPVDGPDVAGAMMTPSGQFAVPAVDHQAYKEGKKERPPFQPEPEEPIHKPEIPEDLVCTICKDLLTDAVMIPCCGNSFCDECVRTVLIESEEHECPDCKEKDVSPDTLIPNRFLRNAVNNFRNETGYNKMRLRAQSTTVETAPEVTKIPTESIPETPESQQPPGQPIRAMHEAGRPIEELDRRRVMEGKHHRSMHHGNAHGPPPPGVSHGHGPPGIPHGHGPPPPGVSHGHGPPGVPHGHGPPPPGIPHGHGPPPPGVPHGHGPPPLQRSMPLPPGVMVHMMPAYPGPPHLPPHMFPMQQGLRRSLEERPGTPTVDERSTVEHLPDTSVPPPPLAPYHPPMQSHFPPARGFPPRGPGFDPGPSFHHEQGYDRGGYRGSFMRGRGRPQSAPYRGPAPPEGANNGTISTGGIVDPLTMFEHLLREKDARDRKLRRARRSRSYSRSRSASRSYSRSRSRSPRKRSRSRSFTMSRSRSFSPLSREYTPHRRYRSPLRSPHRYPQPTRPYKDERDYDYKEGREREYKDGRDREYKEGHDRNYKEYKDRDYKDRDYKDREYKERDYKDRDYKERDYKDREYKERDFKERPGFKEPSRDYKEVREFETNYQWSEQRTSRPPRRDKDFYNQANVAPGGRYPPYTPPYKPQPPNSRPYENLPANQRGYEQVSTNQRPYDNLSTNQRPYDNVPANQRPYDNPPANQRTYEERPYRRFDVFDVAPPGTEPDLPIPTPHFYDNLTPPGEESRVKKELVDEGRVKRDPGEEGRGKRERDKAPLHSPDSKKRRQSKSPVRGEHREERKPEHRDSGEKQPLQEDREKKREDRKEKDEKKIKEKDEKKEKEEKKGKEEKKVKDKEKKKRKKDKDSEDKKKKKRKERKEGKKDKEEKPKEDVPAEVVVASELVAEEEPTESSVKEAPVGESLYSDMEDTRIDDSIVANYVQPPSEAAGELVALPELSRWELDEELTSPSSQVKVDAEVTDKVTSEVLKRAENAIFQKAINAIRPNDPIPSSKKPSERKERERKVDSEPREARRAGNSIQITIPVEIPALMDLPINPPRNDGSFVSRNEGPFVPRNEGSFVSRNEGSFLPMPSVKIKGKLDRSKFSVANWSDPASPVRVSAKDRLGARVDEPRPTVKSEAHRESRRRERRRSDKERSGEHRERRREARSPPIPKPTLDVVESKEKPEEVKEETKKEEKPAKKIIRKKSSDKKREKKKKDREVAERKKSTLDEASFEPDYDLSSEGQSDDSSGSSSSDSSATRRKRSKRKHKRQSSSSDDSSSDSTAARKKRHKKHHKKSKSKMSKKKKKTKHR